MTGTDDLPGRLLDAQVAWVLGQLNGERLQQLLVRDVDDLLAIAERLTVQDVVDVDTVKETARLIATRTIGSPLVDDLVTATSDEVYGLSASDRYRLGDVVDRDAVEALVAKVLGLHRLHERLLDRLTESPLVAVVASKFVTKIVGDFLQQNRARAEKVPGMSSLLSVGTSAVSKVRSATDRHLDQLLGDAAGKGAAYALRRTNSAILELLREAPVQGAVMEVWDLHADDPVGELREYLSQQELRELVVLVHAVVVSTRDTDYARDVLDACVDVFFERHGSRTLASLLDELGLERDDLVAQAQAYAPKVLDALRADGALEDIVRTRLAPFFRSAEVIDVLGR